MNNPLNLSEPDEAILAENREKQDKLRQRFAVGNPYAPRLAECESLLERLQKQDVRDLREERKLQTEIADCRRQLGI